ncbi:putative MATE family efflux protein [Hydrogenivirga caldilitoris]|uniref:Multidrug-efflux transporter n=1 Tax=Hydrogenivirga caldilitoris TaxID=246264 RepID=A0A497XNN9_9AQUI|nr:MATE family efflux transporter [Hydrogenivirga caldilitoris]RLJ69871.1 putative MATE family efflux protein [Hydrogenivirga caldilitoris]
MQRVLINPEAPKSENAKKIIKLAFPIIVVNLLYTVESMFSLVLVSGISASAVAAVGFSLSLLWFIYSLMALSYTGTSVLVAQKVGAGEDPSPVLSSGLLISFLIALPLTFFGKDLVLYLMSLLGASDRVVSLSSEYLTPIFWFITVGFMTNTFYGAFNGAGDTRTPMKVAVLMNVVNISTAYCLIYGKFGLPKLGVQGAGWGIVFSELLAFLIYLYLTRVLKKPFPLLFSVDKETLLKMVRIGTPTAVERAVTSLSFNVFVGFIAHFGDKVLAAHQVGLRIEGISFMVGFGFMVASTVIAGQNYGAKNLPGLIYGVRFTANLTAALMGILGLVLILFPKYLSLPFSRDPEVIRWAVYYLIIVGISQVPMAYAVIFSGALKGMGRTTIPMVVNIASFWLFRIIPSYLFLKFIHSPLVPWTFMTVEMFLRALLFYLAFKRELRRQSPSFSPQPD